ncbi:hypothetical protein FRC11_013984, partial [Ceratobasidium sp. 423]
MCISSEEARCVARWELFHKSLELLLRPIQEVSRDGEEMVCADGGVHRVHPILAAYMGDLPEQLLVTCTQQYRGPICLVPPDEKDSIDTHYKHWHAGTIEELGIREITNLFWANLPYTDIFACVAPDILHQLDKGIFGDYMVKWGQKILGEGEFDDRLKGTPRQWTGNEAKVLGHIYLPVVAGTEYDDFTRAARAIVDFQSRARLPELSDADLADLTNDLRIFHATKSVIIEAGARTAELGFDGITKLHMLLHFVEWVRRMGTLDGFNTEISERLHIDYVKKPWRGTNHVEAIEQMITHLQRREAWAIACAYMYERNLLPQSLRWHYESRGATDYQPRNRGVIEDEADDIDVEGVVLGNGGVWSPGLIWHPAPTIYLAKQPTLDTKLTTGIYLARSHGAL